ncbi:hypothetical protein [Streptomyces solincola]|uniref:hypothetical protein n=1 Tax=Streptomyces solincola TaxID=2100817 RepID=UPI0011B2727F|nr:hypothetical protein [Streptomyces solincola]
MGHTVTTDLDAGTPNSSSQAVLLSNRTGSTMTVTATTGDFNTSCRTPQVGEQIPNSGGRYWCATNLPATTPQVTLSINDGSGESVIVRPASNGQTTCTVTSGQQTPVHTCAINNDNPATVVLTVS